MKKLETFFQSPKKVAAAVLAVILVVGGLVVATSKVNASNSSSSTGIGLEKSVEVALADAGFEQSEVSNLRASFDRDDGVDVYDVYFIAGGYEYEYTVKASDGTIIDSTIETPDGKQVTAEDTQDIGLEKAKSIALDHAGLKENQVDITKAKSSTDDGRQVYEIEFFKDNIEYDYEILASTGDILEHSKDAERATSGSSSSSSSTSGNTGSSSSAGSGSSSGSSGSSSSSSGSSQSGYIGVDKAKTIALKDAGVSSSSATFTKAKLDRDDGYYLYDIEFYAGDMEYEYEINALTGDILERDRERMDHDDYWD